MKLGSETISKIYLGEQEVSSVYLGENLVLEKTVENLDYWTKILVENGETTSSQVSCLSDEAINLEWFKQDEYFVNAHISPEEKTVALITCNPDGSSGLNLTSAQIGVGETLTYQGSQKTVIITFVEAFIFQVEVN